MIGGFFLIGGTLLLGDVLPDNIQVLLFVGGVASVVGQVRWRQSRDESADYPYPAQKSMSGGRRR